MNTPRIEVLPRDIGAYKSGNTGIDYVHRFDSGRPGPHVVVNALTHGNEFCGMTALTWLFERNVRPVRGTLTLSFANVAAYERFDAQRPLDSRFVDRDFNRVWSHAILDGSDDAVEVRRARELAPVFAKADALLDIHSTAHPVRPMLVLQDLEKTRNLARRLGRPQTHILFQAATHPGGLLIEFGAFGDPKAANTAIVVECGQHFACESGDVAIDTMLRFLGLYGILEEDFVAAHTSRAEPADPSVYAISEVRICKGADARFVRPLQGFEEFSEGELIGFDGAEEIRAPYARCAVIMPKIQLVPGREMVTLARRL